MKMLPQTFGLVVFSQYNDKIYYHLTQRRDSLAYIHFLRGKVEEHQVSQSLSKMTSEEKDRLIKYPFEVLWNDLHSGREVPLNEEAANKFKSLEKALARGYQASRNESINLEWGIPKGRKRFASEPTLVCALREYREETRNQTYLDFADTPPLDCLFPYQKITFYIARSKRCPSPHYYKSGPLHRYCVSEETHDLKWATLQEAKYLLPNDARGLRLYRVLEETEKRIREGIIFTTLSSLIRNEKILEQLELNT